MSADIIAQTTIPQTNEQFSGEIGVNSPQVEPKDSDPRVVTENRRPVPSPEDSAELRLLSNRKLELEKKLSELYKDLELINSKLEQHKSASTASTGGKRGGRKRKVSPVANVSTPPKKAKIQTPKKTPPPVVPPRPKRTRRKSTILREAEGTEVQLSPGLASCVTVMRQIMSHRWAGPFNIPVDPVALNIPDYFLIIKHPMDFGTVKSKLESGQYEDVNDFCADMNLVFSNACTYNRPGSDVYIMAQTIQEVFKKKMKNVEEREQQRERKAQLADDGGIIELKKSVDSICQELQLLIQTQTTVTVSRSGRTSTTPKPEDPPMTKEEMKRLSTAINSLPFEHLSAIVKIINEKLPPESTQSELDFDINVLDNATLRRLEAYVDSVKRKKNPRSAKSPSPTSAIQQMELQLQQLISKTGDQLVPTSGKTVVKGPEESEESSDSESDGDSSSDSESSSDESDSDSESGSDSESDVD